MHDFFVFHVLHSNLLKYCKLRWLLSRTMCKYRGGKNGQRIDM